jgi:hypothetical protein
MKPKRMRSADQRRAQDDPQPSSSDSMQCAQRQAVVSHMGCCSMSSIQGPTTTQPVGCRWETSPSPTRPVNMWTNTSQTAVEYTGTRTSSQTNTKQAAHVTDETRAPRLHGACRAPRLHPPAPLVLGWPGHQDQLYVFNRPALCRMHATQEAATKLVCSSMCCTSAQRPPALQRS